MKLCILILVFHILPLPSFGQTLIGTTGNGSAIVSMSLGESIIGEGSSTQNQLTYGFQQPNLWAVSLDDQRIFDLKVFPNPVIEVLTIEPNLIEENKVINLSLFNTSGQLIEEKSFSSKASTTIDFTHFSSGTYLLHITSKQKTLATYKIIKSK